MPTILLMLILFVDDDAETVSFYPYSEQNVHECVTVASSLNRRLDRIRDLRNDDVVDHELGKVWRFRNVDASNVDDARFECDVVSVEPRPSRATTERAQQEHEALLGRIAALAQEEQLRQPTVEELTTPARKSRKQAQRPEEEAPAAASKASLAGLPAADQAWVRSSCSRVLGPAVWASCVEREVRAIRAGMPDISELPAADQAWIRSSCSRVLGPAVWASCVEREVRAIRAGIPDISELPASDQAWIRSSCSRVLGPAVWANCIEREAQTFRATQ